MSIYKTNKNLPETDRIDLINDMAMELNGMVGQGKFDINELNQIYSDFAIDRQFRRNVTLGHTLLTYNNWAHIKEEDGYSIWRIEVSDYAYNSVNCLYFDDNVMDNRGEADSELPTAFDLVYVFDAEGSGAGEYLDYTASAAIEEGNEFELMDTAADYLYLGLSTTFSAAKFEWYRRGAYYDLVLEYYGASGWTELTVNLNNLDDDTSNFESAGKISWDIPDDWLQNAVNSQTYYWVRISTTQVPVTVASCYYLIAGDSVVAKLALSSSQVLDETWAWCNYGTYIYVTIRNVGQGAYEGDYYITSASTATNRQNFFIYNHEYKADY